MTMMMLGLIKIVNLATMQVKDGGAEIDGFVRWSMSERALDI